MTEELPDWSDDEQAEMQRGAAGMDAITPVFLARFDALVAAHPELREAIDRQIGQEAHRRAVADHLRLLWADPRDPDVQEAGRQLGASHIRGGVRPSWHVLAYNEMFPAYHAVEKDADLPSLHVLRRRWLRDLSVTLDAYHDELTAHWAAERGQLQRTLSAVRHESRTDPLTGLPNRRALGEIFQAATLPGTSAHLAVLDLDGFKQLNDRLGHHTGDQVLHAIGQSLSASLRQSDVAVRIGGDEFCLWLAGDQPIGALVPVLRRVIARLSLATWQLDVSVGVAAWPTDGADLTTLFCAADEALYRVKRAGRGGLAFAADPRVVRWNSEPPEPGRVASG